MDTFTRKDIMGYPIAVGTVRETAEKLTDIAAENSTAYTVAAADVHVITRGIENPPYGQAVLEMDLICPDGMPIVKLLNKGETTPQAQRISGPDLMDCMLGLILPERETRHFFLGSTDSTLALLCDKVKTKYPACHIAGVYSPPFGEWSEADYADMISAIKESQANVIWVGLGCPKQELWVHTCRPMLSPGVYLTVGAAFDFHAGTVKRAPLWMQKSSLEWLYRLLREPKRLFKRYFRYNSLFLYYLLTDKKVISASAPKTQDTFDK